MYKLFASTVFVCKTERWKQKLIAAVAVFI